jgi:hypothetical protein
MRTLIFLLIVTSSGIAGCAVEGWTKPKMTDQQRKTDLYECDRDARRIGEGVPYFRSCMEAKGYTQQK